MSVHNSINDGEDDIYRGDNPQEQQQLHPEPAPSVSSRSSSSSDSSSSFLPAGRIGAIAAKLELAISRWAKNVRGNSSSASSSSTSSSSSSSRSSVLTLTKSQLARRKRRRPSISSLRTLQSERDIAARITRMKALQESRQIPREFALYLPPAIMPPTQLPPSGAEIDTRKEARDRRVTYTTSLPLILGQLEIAMRKGGRQRRARRQRGGRARSPSPTLAGAVLQDPLIGGGAGTTPQPRRGRKGKHREQNNLPKPTTIPEEPQPKPQAWFLDVANPSWADLRAIGRLLHIHPLTLEDILQQDPREKLEIFSKLGYYFIAFRAMESQDTREKTQRGAGLVDSSALDEGSVGEANVYLTVFNDGICCFHFTDVSEHTDRVRNRMVLLEEVANMSSDWIAHGILDSIVDSFFPFLDEIEKEVTAIDHLVYTGNTDLLDAATDPAPLVKVTSPTPDTPTPPLKPEKSSTFDSTPVNEKYTPAEKLRDAYRPSHRPRFASPRLTIPLLFRRAKRHLSGAWKAHWVRPETAPSSMHLTLRRMARTRKLVTILGRLLISKSDVITQIRKRLMKSVDHEGGAGQTGEELEIAIYMGDIQDHILTLQQSLGDYERMLSQSHPTYLSQLRSSAQSTKGGTDKNLLYLTIVSISVLCLQTLTGLFSLNINVPHNNQLLPNGRYIVFSVVLVLASLILTVILAVVRYWWQKAKRRRGAPL